MVYSVLRNGNQYSVVDGNGNFIDDETGKKADMQAKADRLNAEQEEQSQNDKADSVNDSDSSNAGINSTGENEEQTEKVSSGKGLEETSEDDTSARAPFVSENQNTNAYIKPESIKQEAAQGKTNKQQGLVRFVLTKSGWLKQ